MDSNFWFIESSEPSTVKHTIPVKSSLLFHFLVLLEKETNMNAFNVSSNI